MDISPLPAAAVSGQAASAALPPASYLTASRLAASPLAVSQLSGPAAEAGDTRPDPKLVSAAHQFEASLMQELLKPLSSGQLFGEDEDEQGGSEGDVANLTSAGDGSGGALMSFSSEALAKALSEKGGLGIARKVLDQFEAAAKTAKLAAAAETPAKIQNGRTNHY